MLTPRDTLLWTVCATILMVVLNSSYKKTPLVFTNEVLYLNSDDVLLSHGNPTLPSAMLRFTSEFEMVSGGATALLSPENWLLLMLAHQKTDVHLEY